ncbi:hypothetical protein [Chryseobacterium sp.]|uniref:hypothetical protein n=1 Tax=Chryseobacterium sp. TaxID=1871047 RepID=UPI00289A02F4|nr:hypothetical protein [Chryseobacterium sp.]
MINKVLGFVEYIKNKSSFYTIEDNLEEKLKYTDKKFNFIAAYTKEDFLDKWEREITDEDL